MRTVGVLGVSALLVSCSSSASRPGRTSTNPSTSSAKSAALTAPADRCGQPQDSAARSFTLRGPKGASMPGIDVGSGSTIAVLLHETDGDGLCGFWPFADWLATTHKLRAVLFDLCGYGSAVCADVTYRTNQLAQVALAVQWARAHGGRRIVLVGASMGGALALGAAPASKANAIVDLSGPEWWPGADAAVAARRLQVPALVATSPGDSTTDFRKLRAAFAMITSAPKRFVTGDGPHGWNLLAGSFPTATRWRPLATTVANWIAGRYQ